MRRSIVLALIPLIGCGAPPTRVQLPPPNPNGCYVIVYERPRFQGAADLWNGPGRWSSLDGQRQTRSDGWQNHIRSLRIGSAGTITAFTDPSFGGEFRQFTGEHAQLDGAFSGRIESLQLTCR